MSYDVIASQPIVIDNVRSFGLGDRTKPAPRVVLGLVSYNSRSLVPFFC